MKKWKRRNDEMAQPNSRQTLTETLGLIDLEEALLLAAFEMSDFGNDIIDLTPNTDHD